MDFFVRYINDDPTLAYERSLDELLDKVRATAVGLAILGEVDAGTRFLDILHQSGLQPFDHNGYLDPYTKPCFYFAWECTGEWPQWVPEDERKPEKIDALEVSSREAMTERFAPEWKVDEDTFWMAHRMGQNIHCNSKDFFGPFPVRVFHIQQLWFRRLFPWLWNQMLQSCGRVIAFDLLFRLRKWDMLSEYTTTLAETHLSYGMVPMLGCVRTAWREGFFTAAENPLVVKLDIDPVNLEPIVEKGCMMLKYRLENGPLRPFQNKSYRELLEIINDHTLQNGDWEHLGSINREKVKPDSIIKPPTAESEIAILDGKLGLNTPLPASYKEFLRHSNGLDHIWEGRHLLRILGPTTTLCTSSNHHFPFALVNISRLCGRDSINWPMLTHTVRLNVSTSSDGDTFLVEPEYTREAKRAFFHAYETRDEAGKATLRRLAEETYGSLEELERLEWAFVYVRHWYGEVIPYKDAKSFLERHAEASLSKKRQWSVIFDPGLKIVDADLYPDIQDDVVAITIENWKVLSGV